MCLSIKTCHDWTVKEAEGYIGDYENEEEKQS